MALLHIPSAKYLNILLFSFSLFRLSYSLSIFSSLCIPLNKSEIGFTDKTEWVVGGGQCLRRTKQRQTQGSTAVQACTSFVYPGFVLFLLLLVGLGAWGAGLHRRRGVRLITPHTLEGYLAI